MIKPGSVMLALTLLFACHTAVLASAEDDAIHNELRQVLKGITTAVNSGKYSDLKPFFHEKLRITTINQEVLSKRGDIDGYFQRWFGPKGYLKKLHMELKPDAKTEFYANKTMGIVRGSGVENYTLSDTRYFEMKTRWTATVIKDTDGKWRILALHIGVNFLDNPILHKAEKVLLWFAAGGAVGGIILFWLLSLLFRRRRS